MIHTLYRRATHTFNTHGWHGQQHDLTLSYSGRSGASCSNSTPRKCKCAITDERKFKCSITNIHHHHIICSGLNSINSPGHCAAKRGSCVVARPDLTSLLSEGRSGAAAAWDQTRLGHWDETGVRVAGVGRGAGLGWWDWTGVGRESKPQCSITNISGSGLHCVNSEQNCATKRSSRVGGMANGVT